MADRPFLGPPPTTSTGEITKSYVDSAVATAQAVASVAVTTSKTLALTDAYTGQDSTATSGITITVPPNSSVAFVPGTIIEITQLGSGGQITVAAGAGVTINSPGALVKTRVQYSSISLRKLATNTWVLSGDLA